MRYGHEQTSDFGTERDSSANMLAFADHSRTTWVSEEEWRELLADSGRLQSQIRAAEYAERPTTHLWEALRPINEALRSPLVMVSGIDDLTAEERREKAIKPRRPPLA